MEEWKETENDIDIIANQWITWIKMDRFTYETKWHWTFHYIMLHGMWEKFKTWQFVYLFLVYFTTLSIVKTILYQMTIIND